MTTLVEFEVTGLTPVLMHATTGMSPLHPLVKELKGITAKRKKLDEDLERISQLEWNLSLYHDPKTGPYLPAIAFLRSAKGAAKFEKLGKAFDRGVGTVAEKCTLQYKGPRDVRGLWDECFYDIRPVVVQRARLLRCRPVFENWKTVVEFRIDTTIVDVNDFERIFARAGECIGVGDFRPDSGGGPFGTYTVKRK